MKHCQSLLSLLISIFFHFLMNWKKKGQIKKKNKSKLILKITDNTSFKNLFKNKIFACNSVWRMSKTSNGDFPVVEQKWMIVEIYNEQYL